MKQNVQKHYRGTLCDHYYQGFIVSRSSQQKGRETMAVNVYTQIQSLLCLSKNPESIQTLPVSIQPAFSSSSIYNTAISNGNSNFHCVCQAGAHTTELNLQPYMSGNVHLYISEKSFVEYSICVQFFFLSFTMCSQSNTFPWVLGGNVAHCSTASFPVTARCTVTHPAHTSPSSPSASNSLEVTKHTSV